MSRSAFAHLGTPSTPHQYHSTPHRPSHVNVSRTPQSSYYHTPATSVQRGSPVIATLNRRQPRCASCGSTSLRENDLGFFACTDCGAQSQEHMAITQEVEEEMYGNMQNILRTGTRIKRSTKKAVKLSTEDAELVRSQLLLHGFHCLLQHQCRVLILHFGVPTLIVGIVGRLWLTYVAQWKDAAGSIPVASPTSIWGVNHRTIIIRRYLQGSNTVQAANRSGNKKDQTESSLQDEDGNESSPSPLSPSRGLKRPRDETEEDENMEDESKKRIRNDIDGDVEMNFADDLADLNAATAAASHSSKDTMQLAPGELSMSLSVALLYLGCHLLREPVPMQQLCTWIHLGRLPFFHVRLPDAIRTRVQLDPVLRTFFHPQAIPAAPRLMILAAHVARCVAGQMERQALVSSTKGGDEAGQAQLTQQQAQLLREMIASTNGSGVINEEDSSASSVVLANNTANTSLLLRTWLEQLSLPPQFHPLCMEIYAELDVANQAPPVTSTGRPRKASSVKKDDVLIAANATAKHHLALMACLVLAVQLTYGTTTHDRSHAVSDSSIVLNDAKPLPTFLSHVLQSTSSSTSTTTAAPLSGSGSSVTSLPPVSSIAANWSTAHATWPTSVPSARALQPEEQTPFVAWMGEVVLSRLPPPKDFGFYTDHLDNIAHRRTHGVRPSVHSSLATGSNTSLLSSILACEEVVSYAQNRRGEFHPLYSSLLSRCSRILGIPSSQLHTAVQRLIQGAKDMHGAGSIYVNTNAQVLRPPPSAARLRTSPLTRQRSSARDHSSNPRQSSSEDDDDDRSNSNLDDARIESSAPSSVTDSPSVSHGGESSRPSRSSSITSTIPSPKRTRQG